MKRGVRPIPARVNVYVPVLCERGRSLTWEGTTCKQVLVFLATEPCVQLLTYQAFQSRIYAPQYSVCKHDFLMSGTPEMDVIGHTMCAGGNAQCSGDTQIPCAAAPGQSSHC